MRVLIVHNRHRSGPPSGENRVVDEDAHLLEEAGVDVELYQRSNDELEQLSLAQRAGLAVRPFYSREDVTAFGRRLQAFRPDIVHLHNPFPLISPWIVRTAKAAGIPVVQTVHNYRHVCPAATFFRDGHICHDCEGRRVAWPAALHGCYRGSAMQSAGMALAIAAHRSTWRLIDRYLAISDAVATHLRDAGVPAERIIVRTNAVRDPGPPAPLGRGLLFAGRLHPEKGYELLLSAWHASGLAGRTELVIAGDGDGRPAVEAVAGAASSVRYMGSVDARTVEQLVREARAVVVPSLWEEPFGLAVIEGFAGGRPVIGTAVGAIQRLVDDEVGWLVQPTPEAVATAMVAATGSDADARGAAARRRYEALYSPVRAVERLEEAYRSVIAEAAGAAADQPASTDS